MVLLGLSNVHRSKKLLGSLTVWVFQRGLHWLCDLSSVRASPA